MAGRRPAGDAAEHEEDLEQCTLQELVTSTLKPSMDMPEPAIANLKPHMSIAETLEAHGLLEEPRDWPVNPYGRRRARSSRTTSGTQTRKR